MTDFSVSDAAVEGFRVIRDRWRVLIGWSAFNLLALVGLFVLLAVVVTAVALASASRGSASEAGGIAASVVVGLGSLFVQVVIITGLLRLMLRPEAPGFLHLRMGADELRVLGALALLVLAALPMVAAAGFAVALLAKVSGPAATLAGIALAGAVYAVMLRLALAPVIAFAEARIDLLEAWRRTRGQTWRLVGMAVLLACLVAMIAVAAWVVVFVVGGLLTGFHDLGLSGPETMAQHPGRYIFQLLAEMLLTPFFLAIGQAPWVAVYRALPKP